jgi:hypothetical protein
MRLLKRIVNWLTTANSSFPRKGHPDLYPISVTKLTKELNLIPEAKRLGEAGIPTPDDTLPSGPESAAIQRVEKARQDYVDWAVLRLAVLNKDLSKRNITQEINHARQADQEFERKASALFSEKDSLLRKLREAALNSEEELKTFKSKHCLTRDARYPTDTKKFLQIMLLLILIVFEGFLNSTFFAQGLDTGLIGGAIQAMMLAALNVTVAYLFGRFLVRYINHVNIAWKILGFLSFLAALVVMVFIGLGIAHYRDALTSEMADPARAALQSILAHPHQLRDFFSWILFAISAVFGVASLIDGLLIEDLYPGYGSISKRTRQTIEDYEEELNELREKLEELKNEELKALEQTMQHAQADVALFASLIDDKRAAKSRLLTALCDADNSLDAILHNFRTENQIYRKGLPRPAYFDARPNLRPLMLPDFDTTKSEASLVAQRELINVLLSEEQSIRARIQAAFIQHFDRLQPLNTHFVIKETEQWVK